MYSTLKELTFMYSNNGDGTEVEDYPAMAIQYSTVAEGTDPGTDSSRPDYSAKGLS